MRKGNNANHPVKGSTIKVEPIRKSEDIDAIKELLKDAPRNLALFTIGIYTPLKVSDLLKIRVGEIANIKKNQELNIPANGLEKTIKVRLNQNCIDAIEQLIQFMADKKGNSLAPSHYLFEGRQGPLTIQAFNSLVKGWCAKIDLKGNYGSHTLRKTFGYQGLFQYGMSLSELMVVFRHSTQHQTLKYMCIRPNEIKNIPSNLTLPVNNSSNQDLAQQLIESDKKVAEMQQMINELKESEDKFKRFFENANDQIVYTDIEGRIIEVNDATWDIFGQTREEAMGKHISDLGIFSQETLNTIFEQSKITAKDNQPPRVELEAFHRDGSTVYIDVNSKLMKKDDEIIGIISIVRDITARKKVEAALQESKEMARALLNATMDSVMLLDANGIILDLNASYAENFSMSVDETIGQCLWDLLPPEMVKEKKDKFDEVFESGESARLEEEFQDRWFDNVVYPVPDINKKVSSLAIFSHDITTRKQAEEALRDHSDKLENLVKERTANLEDANTALKVLLKRREDDKVDLEEKMLINIKELVLPFLEELKMNGLNSRQQAFTDIIESNLNDVISPFVHSLSKKYYTLSPMEIRIANIIKQGKSTKEIADILKMSPRTIDNHRYNIRRKLGINNKKANLTTHLLSIQ